MLVSGVQSLSIIMILRHSLFFLPIFLSFIRSVFSYIMIIIIQFEMNFQRHLFHYCDYVGVIVVTVAVVDFGLVSNFHRWNRGFCVAFCVCVVYVWSRFSTLLWPQWMTGHRSVYDANCFESIQRILGQQWLTPLAWIAHRRIFALPIMGLTVLVWHFDWMHHSLRFRHCVKRNQTARHIDLNYNENQNRWFNA